MRDRRDHVHGPLATPVRAVGGHYAFVKEARLPHRGRDVLYLVGYGTLDSSCCGVAGVAFALVAGFVLSWKERTDSSGHPVSVVEPIRDEATRTELQREIAALESVSEVRFE